VGFLVEKRDGRREWLRATKLARSIRLALQASSSSDEWLATELAAAVIAGLRARNDGAAVGTAVIADSVARVMVAAGCVDGAAAYAAVRSERERRRAELGRIEQAGKAALARPAAAGRGSAATDPS